MHSKFHRLLSELLCMHYQAFVMVKLVSILAIFSSAHVYRSGTVNAVEYSGVNLIGGYPRKSTLLTAVNPKMLYF